MARPSAPLVWDEERPYWMQEPAVSSRRRRYAVAGGVLFAGLAGLLRSNLMRSGYLPGCPFPAVAAPWRTQAVNKRNIEAQGIEAQSVRNNARGRRAVLRERHGGRGSLRVLEPFAA